MNIELRAMKKKGHAIRRFSKRPDPEDADED